MRQLALDIARPPTPTLDNYVPGRNAELLDSLRRLAIGTERFVCIWGVPGSGRSHLLQGVIAAARETGGHAVYVTGVEPFPLLGAGAGFDCVAVDDVERLDAAAQIALFNLYNALREGGGRLVAAADAPPMQLKLRADLVTRLGWGLVYEAHALSDEEKAQALKRHAAGRGFRLADDVCAYLLQRVRRDMPSLLAMLEALDRHSLETKRQVTVSLVRELLQAGAEYRPEEERRDP
jgi:DnaA-homolog protein